MKQGVFKSSSDHCTHRAGGSIGWWWGKAKVQRKGRSWRSEGGYCPVHDRKVLKDGGLWKALFFTTGWECKNNSCTKIRAARGGNQRSRLREVGKRTFWEEGRISHHLITCYVPEAVLYIYTYTYDLISSSLHPAPLAADVLCHWGADSSGW